MDCVSWMSCSTLTPAIWNTISGKLLQRKALSVSLGCTCPANKSSQWFAHQFAGTRHFLKGSLKPRWLSSSWAKAFYLSFGSNCLETRKMLAYLFENRKHFCLWGIARAPLFRSAVLKLLSWHWKDTNHVMTWSQWCPAGDPWFMRSPCSRVRCEEVPLQHFVPLDATSERWLLSGDELRKGTPVPHFIILLHHHELEPWVFNWWGKCQNRKVSLLYPCKLDDMVLLLRKSPGHSLIQQVFIDWVSSMFQELY